MADFDRESMLEMFIYEMSQLLEQLEQNIIEGESGYTMDRINEIFRIMHTIKGSAAMMLFDNISTTAHSIEDLFYFLREGGESQPGVDYSKLTDLVLEGMDFIKTELGKIEQGQTADGDGSNIIKIIKLFLSELKGEKPGAAAEKADKKAAAAKKEPDVKSDTKNNQYECWIKFEEGSEMENIRAFTLLNNIKEKVQVLSHDPEDLLDEEMAVYIRRNGFTLNIATTMTYQEMHTILSETIYLKSLSLKETTEASDIIEETDAGIFTTEILYL